QLLCGSRKFLANFPVPFRTFAFSRFLLSRLGALGVLCVFRPSGHIRRIRLIRGFYPWFRLCRAVMDSISSMNRQSSEKKRLNEFFATMFFAPTPAAAIAYRKRSRINRHAPRFLARMANNSTHFATVEMTQTQ